MSLYQEWTDLMNNQTDATFRAFWDEYAAAEKSVYTGLLESDDLTVSGTVKDLADQFGCRPVMFTGFLDGVLTSLREGCSVDVENVTEDSEVTVTVDPEKLYTNMLKAEAAHLSSLPAWENVLTEERRAALTKDYKRSKIYHAPKKVGGNDPCPCGSGKKYKNCCGRNA